MPKKLSDKESPNVHEDLSGFDMKVNEFGELTSNVNIDKLNDFLDDKVVDKKLEGREEEE